MINSELSAVVVQDLCQRYSQQKFGKVVQFVDYTLKRSSDVPAGFLGRHETLCIKIQQTLSDQPHEVVLFVKSAPSDIASRAMYIEEFGVFKKEICFYANCLPNLEKGFPEFVPKCFYAKDNMLVFDHLGDIGFNMGADRSGILDYDHLNCALKSLASLHASSITYDVKHQHKIPEAFPDVVMENAYPAAEHGVRLVNFNNAIASICELIKIMPAYKDSSQLDFVLKEFHLKMRIIFELCQPSTKYFNVLNHGDLWANNILFKYENGRPVESRLVDFQLTRYAPPILDVITLLTIPTSRDFRNNYMDTLLKNYYSMLGELLTQNDLDVEDFIPQKEFEDSIAEFRLCGLIESCLFAHLTVLSTQRTQSLTADTDGFNDFFNERRSEICLTAFQTDEVYRRRMSDMISDIIDNFILS